MAMLVITRGQTVDFILSNSRVKMGIFRSKKDQRPPVGLLIYNRSPTILYHHSNLGFDIYIYIEYTTIQYNTL